jgi:15-cis-phytoene synthase
MNSDSLPLNISLDAADMRRHSQSFAWASKLLSPAARTPIYALYRLCRAIDDIADCDTQGDLAHAKLQQLKTRLLSEDALELANDDSELSAEISKLSKVQRDALVRLIMGVSGDLGPVRMQNMAALLNYCFSVAGTVGLLVLPALGVSDPRARTAAAALGMAMQLSNIARDVVEDAVRDRIYLPSSTFACALDVKALAGKDPNALRACVPALRQVLAVAEQFYDIAAQGYHFIPLRNRFAVLSAAMLYREIGRVVLARLESLGFAERVVVPRGRKLMLMALSSMHLLRLRPSHTTRDTDLVQRAIQPWAENVLEAQLPWRCA